jgi:hypothetical protein
MGSARGRAEAVLTSLWCAFRPTSARRSRAISGRERTLLATTYAGLPPALLPAARLDLVCASLHTAIGT